MTWSRLETQTKFTEDPPSYRKVLEGKGMFLMEWGCVKQTKCKQLGSFPDSPSGYMYVYREWESKEILCICHHFSCIDKKHLVMTLIKLRLN